MAIATVLAIFLLQRRYAAVVYVIPLSIAACLALFYTAALLAVRGDVLSGMTARGWLCERDSRVVSPLALLGALRPAKLRPALLWTNLRTVAIAVFFSLVHVSYNLPSYRMELGTDVDYTAELGAQGRANLFTLLPCYFISCYSVPFYRCGGVSRAYGLLSAAPLVLVALFGFVVRGYIPRFLLAMPPLLIGFTMMYDTVANVVTQTMLAEQVVVAAIAVVSFVTENYLLGTVGGVLVHLLLYYALRGRRGRRVDGIDRIDDRIAWVDDRIVNGDGDWVDDRVDDRVVNERIDLDERVHDERIHNERIDDVINDERIDVNDLDDIKNIEYIKINYFLCFMTVDRFVYDFSADTVVVDLCECPAIDWLGSDLLFDAIKKSGKNVFVVGDPLNLKRRRFRGICTLVKERRELKEKLFN